MNIFWRGQSCFEIIANPVKNGQVKIVIDPYSQEIGLKPPKMEADIVLTTHSHYDHNNLGAVSGSPFVIDGPGEYEVKEIYIRGITSFHDSKEGAERGQNTIYVIEAEDLKICHLGDFGQKELTDEQLEKIGEVDILMIPVGGVYTISAAEASKIMSQIEPKITIPMHYQLPKLTLRRGSGPEVKLDGVDKFLKALGVKSLASEPKLSVKKKDISQDEAKIVVLEP